MARKRRFSLQLILLAGLLLNLVMFPRPQL
jgi:hypothetical protein